MGGNVYLIWERELDENGILSLSPSATCYARTTYEAHKTCVTLANKHLAMVKEGTNITSVSPPLWKGEEPKHEGVQLFFTLPGPNTSSIDIYDVIKHTPWFGGEISFSLGKHLYQVHYTALERSREMVVVSTMPQSKKIDVRHSPKERKPRGSETPMDCIMNAIEKKPKQKGLFD